MSGSYVPPTIASSVGDVIISNVQNDLKDDLGMKSAEAEHREFEEDQKRKRIFLWTVAGVASVSVLTALSTILVFPGIITYIAFSFPFVTAPYAVRGRVLLNRGDTLRKLHNKLCREIKRMSIENEKLSHENDALEKEVARLFDTEESLGNIVRKEGKDLNEFRSLVKENRSLQKKIENALEAEALQDLMTTVIRSDRDSNFKVDNNELEVLINRLKTRCGFDEGRVRKIFSEASSNSVSSIISCTHRLFAERKLKC